MQGALTLQDNRAGTALDCPRCNSPIAVARDSTLVVVVSRAEVEDCDTNPALNVLRSLLSSQEAALRFQANVDVAFHGYDNTNEELFEIPAVRQYVSKLDAEFPYWLYFLSRDYWGLQCISLCFLLPFLTENARAERHPRQLAELIEHRWMPALKHICTAFGLPNEVSDSLLGSAMNYFQFGPRYKQGARTNRA